MEPELSSQLPALRREVERPGSGGHGFLPVLVLAAAMTSTLAAAALAISLTPRAHHCPRSGRSVASAVAPSFARPAAPTARVQPVTDPALAPAAPVVDPACAPRVYRGEGDVQEWTYETCATAPMPRRFVFSTP